MDPSLRDDVAARIYLFFHGSKRTLDFLDTRSDQQGAPALIRKTRLSGLGCQSHLSYFSILMKGAGDQQLLPAAAAVAGKARRGKNILLSYYPIICKQQINV